jgi:cation/acetate symporter
MAGLIAFFGYGGSVFLMGWTGGYVLLALLIAPYLRKHGSFTVPEFIGDRYYSKTARVVAVVCLIIASVTYVIGQMKGIGVAFSRFLEVDYDQGLMVGMAIVFIYAVMGGMKGITYTQIAQYVIMIIAYTIPAIFISFMLTGNPIPQFGLGGTLEDGSYLLDKLDQIITDLGFKEYTTNARLSLFNMFFYTLSLMIGTAGLPHVIMRFFTVPSVKAARSSAGWALVFIAILYTTAPAVAAMARLNLITTIDQPEQEQNLAYKDRPSWFRNWEKTGLLQFEDKNGDGFIQYTGTENNEMVKVDLDIMVLANPEIAGLPNWVIALVAAGGLAAALSTAAILAFEAAVIIEAVAAMVDAIPAAIAAPLPILVVADSKLAEASIKPVDIVFNPIVIAITSSPSAPKALRFSCIDCSTPSVIVTAFCKSTSPAWNSAEAKACSPAASLSFVEYTAPDPGINAPP